MGTRTEYYLNAAGTQWVRPGFAALDASGFVEFAAGAVKPLGKLDSAEGPRNVGCRIPEAQLEVVNGDVTVTPGMIVQGKDIRGRITGTGDSTTLVQDCIVRGQVHTTSQSWSARGTNSTTGFNGAKFKFVTFDQTDRESAFANTFESGGFEAWYCDILRTVDGAEINAVGNAKWYMCRFSHGVYFSWWNAGTGAVRTATFTDYGGNVRTAPFPAQSSGDVHSDGIQAIMGPGNLIRGCNIGAPRQYTSAQTTHLDPTIAADYAIMTAMDADAGFANAALICNATPSNPLGLIAEYNWWGGGTATVNVAAANGAEDFSGVIIRNNRFYRQPGGVGNFAILNGVGSLATFTGNVYDDNGAAVTVTQL